MPEPKDRSFAELDLLFEKRVPARKFGKTSVDVFGETNVEGTTVFGRQL
jgi:SP family general alpha glucoside:H+ symporter-like MFS transporter